MVVVVKRTGLAVTVMLACCLIIAGIMVKHSPIAASKIVVSKSSVIVIDAGHGGADGGAVAPGGACEKNYNLAVAKELQKLLQNANIKTVMTRTDDDIALCPDNGQTPLQRKRADLSYRRDLPKKVNADLLITIHMNKFTNAKARGAQVFYDSKFPSSQQIALCVQKEFVTVLDPQNARIAKAADKSIYLFKSPRVPTILVECGFLSNPSEEANLRKASYQKKLAKCIYNGLLTYMKSQSGKTVATFSPSREAGS